MASLFARPLPPVVRIEPASACNLRCTHCPTGVTKAPRTVMSEATFARILADLPTHIPPIRVAVLYHGGEPFLNRAFLSMSRRIKDLGISFVKTVSNGMLIRPEMLSDIIESGLDAIEFSVDGESAAENDSVRVRSDFEKIVATVRALDEVNQRKGGRLRILVATTQFRKAGDLAIDRPVVLPDAIRRAFGSAADRLEFKVTWALQWPSGDPRHGYDIYWDDRNADTARSCSLLHDTLTIRADGTVVACCYDLTTMSNLGNINESSLVEIWNGERFRCFREAFSAGRYPKLCKGCAVVTGNKYLVPKADNAPPRVWQATEAACGEATGQAS